MILLHTFDLDFDMNLALPCSRNQVFHFFSRALVTPVVGSGSEFDWRYSMMAKSDIS